MKPTIITIVRNELKTENSRLKNQSTNLKSDIDNVESERSNLEEEKESLEEEKNLWAGEVLKELRLKSPLSIFVAFSQIKKAVGLDFDGCIQLDFQLVQHFIRDHDFYEGVRALLVDKDKTPHWNPADFHQVSKSRVDEYFS